MGLPKRFDGPNAKLRYEYDFVHRFLSIVCEVNISFFVGEKLGYFHKLKELGWNSFLGLTEPVYP